jgi:hypothetical protein
MVPTSEEGSGEEGPRARRGGKEVPGVEGSYDRGSLRLGKE